MPGAAGGDRLLAAMAEVVRGTEPQVLLHEGIARSYADFSDRIAASPGVQEVARGGEHTGPGAWAVPRLFTTAAADLSEQLTEECFGPVTVVVRYQQRAQLLEVLDALPASLTATVHRGHDEVDLPREVLHHLRDKAGRFLFDAYPTGVAVSWAQHHGGPWPSTNSQHTSVGTSAIRRFLRPVAYQDVPEDLLPVELREDTSTLPRRVDGALQLPRTPA